MKNEAKKTSNNVDVVIKGRVKYSANEDKIQVTLAEGWECEKLEEMAKCYDGVNARFVPQWVSEGNKKAIAFSTKFEVPVLKSVSKNGVREEITLSELIAERRCTGSDVIIKATAKVGGGVYMKAIAIVNLADAYDPFDGLM